MKTARAQHPPPVEPEITQLIEELFPFNSDDFNQDELFEHFYSLYQEPLNINLANESQLGATLILNEKQIAALIRHRRISGPLLSLYELQSIPELDLPTIRRLLPFVTLSPVQVNLKDAVETPTQHYFVTRFRRIPEKQKGYTQVEPGSRSVTRYAGNPWNWYGRYRFARTGVYSLGLTLEKDAGEIWSWQPKKHVFGIDYTSFHIQLLNRGKLKNLTVGDFQIQAGQGLVFASGFSLGKGAEVIRTTYRSSLGIRPYTSVTEQGFFRGTAITYSLASSSELTVFFSSARRDATISTQGTVFESEVITSFPTDGFHRTPNERSKHGNTTEKNLGAHLQYNAKKTPLVAGVTVLYTEYSLPVEKRNLPYNAFAFRGRINTVTGLHATYRHQNLRIFSESAISGSGGTGSLLGAIAALSKSWDLTFLGRQYQRNFHSFYGNSFREGSEVSNELGFYSGVKYRPSRKWEHSAYLDVFHFPWRKFQVDEASGGTGFLISSRWKPNRIIASHLQLNHEQKQKNNSDRQPGAPVLANAYNTRLIFNMEWKKPNRFSFRLRAQGSRYQLGTRSPSYGLAVANDAVIHIKRMVISGRLAFFNTDNYDSRQYLYERDVLYSFSVPAFYDIGNRHNLMLRFDVANNLRFWIRWAQTRHNRLESIGSGLDEILGARKSEIKFQLQYKL